MQICMSYFRGLERGPIGRWPGGWVWRVRGVGVGQVGGRGQREAFCPEVECEQKQEATGTCMSFSLAAGWCASRAVNGEAGQAGGPCLYPGSEQKGARDHAESIPCHIPARPSAYWRTPDKDLWLSPEGQQENFFRMEQHGCISFLRRRSSVRKGFHQN